MKYNSYLYGFIASIGLLSLYGVTMTILNGWQAAVEQFQTFWYLVVPLIIGFGIQVGLYTMVKTAIQKKAKMTMTTNSTVSGATMLACCVHHITDVAPFLGLAGLSIVLARYQASILGFGIGMNIIGILVMLKHLKKITV